MSRLVLTLSCDDRMGIVAAVADFLFEQQCNIVDSAQFGDQANKGFFMRVCFDRGTLDCRDGAAKDFRSGRRTLRHAVGDLRHCAEAARGADGVASSVTA